MVLPHYRDPSWHYQPPLFSSAVTLNHFGRQWGRSKMPSFLSAPKRHGQAWDAHGTLKPSKITHCRSGPIHLSDLPPCGSQRCHEPRPQICNAPVVNVMLFGRGSSLPQPSSRPRPGRSTNGWKWWRSSPDPETTMKTVWMVNGVNGNNGAVACRPRMGICLRAYACVYTSLYKSIHLSNLMQSDRYNPI
jgi:hypothetical protein